MMIKNDINKIFIYYLMTWILTFLLNLNKNYLIWFEPLFLKFTELQKDVKTEFFLWDVEELTFLIIWIEINSNIYVYLLK